MSLNFSLLIFKCFVAQSFFACFRGSQEDYHEEDLGKLAAITRREHMNSNELMGTLRYCTAVIHVIKFCCQDVLLLLAVINVVII